MLEDVSDMRDVVDAINRLCDTMKTSHYDEVSDEFIDISDANLLDDLAECPEPDAFASYAGPVEAAVATPEVSIRTVDPSERWSDSLASLPLETLASDLELAAPCETSEMYYTASSEVSLLSDTEILERPAVDVESKDDRQECVIAGHVAAMRERFESMTRTNSPCPDLMRSSSPSLDVFRNITPSPDRLG